MALKRATYTRPLGQVLSPSEQEGVRVVVQLAARAGVKRPLVQILVVAANVQMRTLKTEVGKGST